MSAVIERLRRDGLRGISRQVVLKAYRRLDVGAAALDIDPSDIWSSGGVRPAEFPAVTGPARIAWVCRAPAPGSGGHTTLFRMIAALAARGHHNTIAFYDPEGGNPMRHARVVCEHWPWLNAPERVPIVNVADGLDGFDAVVASSWATAHVVARRAPASARLFYFIQDFEPYFFPHGALYALAEDTYRFGFRNIALGAMVRDELAAIGVESSQVPFGIDTSVYSRTNDSPRNGVCVYVRKGNDRRGYLLAKATIERFHERHPEQDIHVYGDEVADWSMPIHNHGHLSPSRLNELYNTVIGGLALSFTNISLISAEMLAAGAIPVMNEAASARADLTNPNGVWAAPTPDAMAAALAEVVESGDQVERSRRAAAYAEVPWDVTQAAVVSIIESELAAGSAVPV